MFWNKIFGAILAAVLMIFVLREVTGMVFADRKAGHSEAGHGEEGHGEAPKYAYYLQTADETAATDAAPEVLDLGTLLASADLSKGERAMNAKCASCHKWDEGNANGTGPGLRGVVGRAMGAVPDFKYSASLSGMGKAWTYDELNGFLEKPSAWMPGTAMNFAGLNRPSERADVIAYLASITPGAPAFPAPAAAAPGEALPADGTAAAPALDFTADVGGVTLAGAVGGVEQGLIGFLEAGTEPCTDKACWFSMDRLTFETGSATLDLALSSAQLDNLVAILNAYPTVQLKIGGYTDNVGDEAANMALSQARAEAVAVALQERGIPAERLNAEGYGSQHPVADNATEEGRAMNRRIDVRIRER
jgi:cytochrome c